MTINITQVAGKGVYLPAFVAKFSKVETGCVSAAVDLLLFSEGRTFFEGWVWHWHGQLAEKGVPCSHSGKCRGVRMLTWKNNANTLVLFRVFNSKHSNTTCFYFRKLCYERWQIYSPPCNLCNVDGHKINYCRNYPNVESRKATCRELNFCILFLRKHRKHIYQS